MSADSKLENMRGFIRFILQTEIPEAEKWIVGFILPIFSLDAYFKMPITETSVGCLTEGISVEISKQIRILFGSGKGYAELYR